MIASLEIEWNLAIRNPTLPLIIIGLLAFCQILMPPADAPYAVLTVNRLKPVMTAAPLLLAVGSMFGAISFPVYLLFLGGGCARDVATGTSQLYLSSAMSQPKWAFWLIMGRILSCISISLSSIGLVLAMLYVSIFLRLGVWPGWIIVTSYLAAITPPVLAAAVFAVVLDMFIINNIVRTSVVFFLWIGLLALSAFGTWLDLFGIRFLGQNIMPKEAIPALAFGFIGGNVNTIPWNVVRESTSHLLSRATLSAGIFALSIAAASGLAIIFRWRLAAIPVKARTSNISGVNVSALVKPAIASNLSAEQFIGRRINIIQTMWLTARQTYNQSKRAKTLMTLAALLALLWPSSGSATTIALLTPIALFRTASRQHLDAGLVLRRTTPGLWQPTPHVLESFIFAVGIVFPLSPYLLQAPIAPLRAIHLFASALTASAWLVYTHRILQRELLGISVYLLAWYILACQPVPAMLDFFAIHSTSLIAFSSAIATAALLCGLIAHADSTSNNR
jgi:hypothetical protein